MSDPVPEKDGSSELLTTLIFGVITAGLAWFLFSKLSKNKLLQRLVFYKRNGPPSDTSLCKSFNVVRDESRITKLIGIEGHVYLRMIRSLFTILLLFSPYCLLVGLFYGLGDGDAKGIGNLTLTHLKDGSGSMWSATVGCYLLAALTIAILTRDRLKVVRLRQQELVQPKPQQFGVLISDIPQAYRKEQVLVEHLRELFSGSGANVVTALLVKTFDEIDACLDEWKAATFQLAKALSFKKDTGETPMVASSVVLLKKESAINYYSKAVVAAEKKILQCKAPLPTATAIVMFESPTQASLAKACGVLQTENPLQWRIFAAPSPDDLILADCTISASRAFVRRIGMFVALFFLVVFFAVPLAFIASLTTLEQLSSTFGFLEPMLDASPEIKGFLQGFLPSLVFILFFALLTKILYAIGRLGVFRSKIKVDSFVLASHFAFFLVNGLLVLSISGSFFGKLEDILDHPSDILSLAGDAFPTLSGTFMNIILTKALVTMPLQLLLIGPLIIGPLIIRYYKSRSCHADWEYTLLAEPDFFPYAERYSNLVFIFALTATFAMIGPLIILACLLFLAVVHTVDAHLLIHVFEKCRSEGVLYLQAWQAVFVGLIFGQLLTLGALSMKEAVGPATALIPLPFLTLAAVLIVNAAVKSGERTPSFEAMQRNRIEHSLPTAPMWTASAQSQAYWESLLPEETGASGAYFTRICNSNTRIRYAQRSVENLVGSTSNLLARAVEEGANVVIPPPQAPLEGDVPLAAEAKSEAVLP